jgi:hypothetical protein
MVPRLLVVVGLCLAGCDRLLDLRMVSVPPAADATDAFMPVIGCSPMSMLAADFADGESNLLSAYGLPSTNTATYNNGALVANLITAGYLSVLSDYHYELRDSEFTIEITDDGGVTDGNEFSVALNARR